MGDSYLSGYVGVLFNKTAKFLLKAFLEKCSLKVLKESYLWKSSRNTPHWRLTYPISAALSVLPLAILFLLLSTGYSSGWRRAILMKCILESYYAWWEVHTLGGWEKSFHSGISSREWIGGQSHTSSVTVLLYKLSVHVMQPLCVQPLPET